MLYVRNRRAAALCGVLGALGIVITSMGLRVEAEALPPLAAVAPPAPASPSVQPRTSGTAATGQPLPAGPAATGRPRPAPSAAKPAAMRRSEPVRLEIPAIELRTRLSKLGLRPDGTIEVPPLGAGVPAGWYKHSPTPGETGAAVFIGHVDSARDGPAVFYRLRELELGDQIAVRRADRSVANFVVTRVASYPKVAFPTEAVYGPAGHPELRLITCGGTFDRKSRTYRNNIVVFAEAR